MSQGRCFEFIFSGCGGNDNRFSDRATCEQRCGTTAVNPEDRPVDPLQPVDPVDPFGQDGTLHTLKLLSTFTSAQRTPHQKVLLKNACLCTFADVCNMEKDVGPCDDYGAVWYFDSSESLCRRFLYGGCQGNGNRFTSRAECESRCQGGGERVEPVPVPVEPTYPPQPTAYPPYEPTQPIGR